MKSAMEERKGGIKYIRQFSRESQPPWMSHVLSLGPGQFPSQSSKRLVDSQQNSDISNFVPHLFCSVYMLSENRYSDSGQVFPSKLAKKSCLDLASLGRTKDHKLLTSSYLLHASFSWGTLSILLNEIKNSQMRKACRLGILT
jgi:hypothetical protein